MRVDTAGRHLICPYLRRLHELVVDSQRGNTFFAAQSVGSVNDVLLGRSSIEGLCCFLHGGCVRCSIGREIWLCSFGQFHVITKPCQRVADQHRHISAGNLGVRNSFFRSKSQLNGSPAGRLIIPYSINIIQAPQHHRAGRRRSNRVIGAVASIAIPCNQIICDAVAHIAFCPFRNIRKAAKAAVKGAVRFKLLGICDNSGEQRRHLRPCQPLLQHHVARLVAQHNAGFTQIGGSRLLRTFFGGKRSYC